MLLFSLILMCAGAGMLYAHGEVDKTLDSRDDCRDYSVFEDADDELIRAALQFCGTVCPCDLKDPSELDTLPPEGKFNGSAEKIQECPCDDLTTFDASELGVPITITRSKVECEELQDTFSEDYLDGNDKYFDLLEWLEEELDCSGMCTKIEWFVFSDINNGDPDDYCINALADFAKEQLLMFGIISLIIGFWFLLVTIWSYCLCYRERKAKMTYSGDEKADAATNK